MDDNAMYKMPTIDLSVKSLLMLSQFGMFATFTWWGLEDSDGGIELVFPLMMAVAGLTLFLSVPNARMGVTLGVPALMAITMVAMGEGGDAVWAIFMLLVLGPVCYMPAMATGDPTLELDGLGSRVPSLGWLYLIFALLMGLIGSGFLEGVTQGELSDEDSEGNAIIHTLDSSDETIAQAGLAIVVVGILVFLLTAMMGMELGPLRPWHGGVLLGVSAVLSALLWSSASGEGLLASDLLFMTALTGLFVLTPCIAYEGDT
jgi:hypothetical protein